MNPTDLEPKGYDPQFFNFEATDFIVLEDIVFDETIQRPEKVRFYTVEEQTVDAFEKLIPRGRVTNFQKNEIKKEVDRFKELYESYIAPTAESYIVKTPEHGRRVDWIHPIYATPELKSYSFEADWMPLYENPRLPNFYPRMVAALPHPFVGGAGSFYSFQQPTEFVDNEGKRPLRALPVYQKTRTQYHEDKTISVIREPIPGTEDTLAFVGYYLERRPLEVPNPLPDHPFFKTNEPNVIQTTVPLTDVYPDLDTILTHGVPVTQDPYGEAEPFLKLYDVSLKNIPWSTWKSKFPQVEPLTQAPEIPDIVFPKASQDAPPEKLKSLYDSLYFPGQSPRYWLMNQLDGGELLIKILLSQASESGTVNILPGADTELAIPDSTYEAGTLVGLPFPSFLTHGLLRRSWTIKGDNDIVKYKMAPLEIIKQERARAGYKNRQVWKESTGTDIMTDYQRVLNSVRPVEPIAERPVAEPITEARPESLRHKEVIAILDDPKRFATDKLRDIQELLKETTLTKAVYSDSNGEFVACSHTLAILSEDFAADRKKFYETWTVREDGFRVCRYCGERISRDDLEAQDDFNDEGFVIRHSDVLNPEAVAPVANISTGLQSLRSLFVMTNAVDDMCFLLLSILQVLPRPDILDVLLKSGRALSAKQLGDKKGEQFDRVRGSIGIAVVVLLLQMHIPTLVPRRSFGPNPLKLSGFPRDEAQPEKYSIVDALMMVLRKTFEAYPSSLDGPSKAAIRGSLNNPAEIRKTVVTLLSAVFMKQPDIQKGMAEARAYFQASPPVEQPKALIPLVEAPKEMDTITRFPECPTNRPIWTSGRDPKIIQTDVPLRRGIPAAENMKLVEFSQSERVPVEPIPKAEIGRRYKLGSKTVLQGRLTEQYHTNLAIAARIGDAFLQPAPVESVDPNQNANELRDIGLGFVYEEVKTVSTDTVKAAKLAEMLTKDAALYTLLSDYTQQKKEANRLRAKERQTIVALMAAKSDEDREITGELMSRGLADYIYTNRERAALARQAELMQEQMRQQELDIDEELRRVEDVGVGAATDYEDQGDERFEGAAQRGNYGDYHANPSNDGRDHEQGGFWEDERTSI